HQTFARLPFLRVSRAGGLLPGSAAAPGSTTHRSGRRDCLQHRRPGRWLRSPPAYLNSIRLGVGVFERYYPEVEGAFPGALEKLKFNETLKRILNRFVGDLIR